MKLHSNENQLVTENLNANKADFENFKQNKPSLEKQYIYFQEIRAFLKDFIDCYNEKIEDLDKAELKWLNLLKQRVEKIAKRRQDDLNDQNSECANAMSANKRAFELEHQKRLSEREARREKRRKARVKNNNSKFSSSIEASEGFSTDNEDDSEINERQKREEIKNEISQEILADINEDFYDIESIKARFEKWKSLNYASYKNAYVSHSLPKLFSPLIRLELIDWNPLESNEIDYLEKSKWFNQLLRFNQEMLLDSSSNKQKDDDDIFLIPQIVEKTLLLKLISLAENVYDPLSVSQTNHFTKLVSKLIDDYPTLNSQSSNTKLLIETVINRFKKSFDQDIFVPLYPKQVIEQKSSELSRFFHRQFFSCLKVYRNVLKWQTIVNDTVLKELSIDRLLNRYLMIGLQSMEASIETISIIEYIIAQMPADWLKINNELTKTMSLPQIANLCRLIRRIADSLTKSSQYKEHMKRIHRLFLSIGAGDQAASLTSAYDF